MKTAILIIVALLTLTSSVAAQTKNKLEVAVQSTSLTLFGVDFPGDETKLGVGGRLTYNFNSSIATEAEVNFFPQKQPLLAGDGNAVQAQFGVKVGKRFKKFGIFGKVRPGFLSVGKVFRVVPGQSVVLSGFTFPNTTYQRHEFFTLDAGGVLEFYPSSRTVVRFEAGDTAIRHPARYDPVNSIPPSVQLARDAKFTHNFQFTAGVGFRLGDFPRQDVTGGNSPTNDETPRYEIGAQFTSLVVDPPTFVCPNCLPSINSEPSHVEPGFGGRFTFNLTSNIGFEAEGNFFTRDQLGFQNPSGHMFQGQFGLKAGKRFERWGLFGKVRPGFVGFTKVSELVSTTTQFFGTIPFQFGTFEVKKKLYPSLDVGGVVEFYVSRHWMTRFDFGDTIIRYGEFKANGFSVSQSLVTRPRETRHNFQVGAGIGYRF